MSDGRKYYCYCDSNCKFETMTKEQILAAIEQAARWDTGVRMVDSNTNKRYALYVSDGKLMMRESDGSEQGSGLDFDVDAAIITKVKETNTGGFITFWVGTQAEYNAIANHDPRCYYHITDSTRDAGILRALEEVYSVASQNTALAVEAKDTANRAASAANSAASAASNALSTANSAASAAAAAQDTANKAYGKGAQAYALAESKTNGMVREFDSGLANALEYTTTYAGAKFYIVTIGIKSSTSQWQNCGTLVIDYNSIDITGVNVMNIVTTINNTQVQFMVQKQATGRVVFQLLDNDAKLRILHIAGYY